MRIELATRKLIKPLTRHLATFALVAGLMGVPGDQRRHRARRSPQSRYVSIDELLRLNDSTLSRLRTDRHLKVKGVMGRFGSRVLIAAIRSNPVRTKRLIDRMERAQSDEERIAIIRRQLGPVERKNKDLVARVKKQRENLALADTFFTSSANTFPFGSGVTNGLEDDDPLHRDVRVERDFLSLLQAIEYHLSNNLGYRY